MIKKNWGDFMKCPYCKRTTPDDSIFCAYCGELQVKEVFATVQEAAATCELDNALAISNESSEEKTRPREFASSLDEMVELTVRTREIAHRPDKQREIFELVTTVSEYIPKLNPSMDYWLLRTQGKDFYNEFVNQGFIAIGWEKLNDLNVIRSGDHKKIRDLLKDFYEDEKRPGLAASELITFVNFIKKGDIVLQPASYSNLICIGEVLDSEITIDKNPKGICPFEKRRRVKWLEEVSRDELDPCLDRFISTHYTITNGTHYSQFIDRSLASLYIKGDKAHIIFEVTKKEEIKATEVIEFIDRLISIVDFINNAVDTDFDKNDIELKVNLQSPGPIELVGPIVMTLCIAIVFFSIVGGGFGVSEQIHHMYRGLSEKIKGYLGDAEKRRKFEKTEKDLLRSNNRLQVKSPKTKDPIDKSRN
jgi:hypothetical protein